MMGDIADDMYDIAQIQMAENDNSYYKYSDKELKETVLFYMNEADYQPDDFTDMVRDILKQNSFSKKQRKVLIGHLYYHEEVD
jgi:uncharacterized tellurite resistance protein B-like protein